MTEPDTTRPSPSQERAIREEGLPPKTSHDGAEDVFAGQAPDTPTFGDTPEPVTAPDEQVVKG